MKSKLIGILLFVCVLIPTHTIMEQSQELLIIQKADELMNLLVPKRNNRDYVWFKDSISDIFSVLNNLELQPKHKLNIDLPNMEGLGDVSHIWVANDNGKRDDNYLKYVKLKSITEESCWEWFLFYYMNNMMPSFWHGGGYNTYEMFYSEKQWEKQIDRLKDSFVPDSSMAESEKNANLLSESKYNKMKETKITPAQIMLNAAKNEATVSFYSWNNWEGLNYNQYELKIKKDNAVKITKSTSETIIKYWNGVFY